MKIKYIGTFSNRSVYGVVMNTGDVQEFTYEQGAHLLLNADEFELVTDEAVKAKTKTVLPTPPKPETGKAKRIGKTASKKKK